MTVIFSQFSAQTKCVIIHKKLNFEIIAQHIAVQLFFSSKNFDQHQRVCGGGRPSICLRCTSRDLISTNPAARKYTGNHLNGNVHYRLVCRRV